MRNALGLQLQIPGIESLSTRALPSHQTTTLTRARLDQMGDSEQHEKAAVPEWQRPRTHAAAESESGSASSGAPVTMQQAKRFLQDDEVRKYPRDKKIEFLKGKGLEEAVIQRLLLDEVEAASQVSSRGS